MKEIFRFLHKAAVCACLCALPSACDDKPGWMPWDDDPNFGKKEEPSTDAEIGRTLPLWTEGCMDIHAVNTGRGECTFIVFPDGTTMLIDAGEAGTADNSVAQKPSALYAPYEVYSRYIKHFMPDASKKIDYALLTHFHNDHLGSITSTAAPLNTEGNYRRTGMYGVCDQVGFAKWVDRIYPDYNQSAIVSTDITTGGDTQTAIFTEYNKSRNGMECEKFDLGSSSQFVLKYKPSDYNFTVQNVASSGVVKVGKTTQDVYGSGTGENGKSCCVLFTYGKFEYLTCGDAGQNGKIEQPLANALNMKIEAMKASHHMSVSTQTPAAMAKYQPQVIVTQSFYIRDEQPNVDVLKALYPSYLGDKYLYFTNIDQSQQDAHEDVYGQAAGMNGHVVIRVAPGGDSFHVFMLDDTNFDYNVTYIKGFNCR